MFEILRIHSSDVVVVFELSIQFAQLRQLTHSIEKIRSGEQTKRNDVRTYDDVVALARLSSGRTQARAVCRETLMDWSACHTDADELKSINLGSDLHHSLFLSFSFRSRTNGSLCLGHKSLPGIPKMSN